MRVRRGGEGDKMTKALCWQSENFGAVPKNTPYCIRKNIEETTKNERKREQREGGRGMLHTQNEQPARDGLDAH